MEAALGAAGYRVMSVSNLDEALKLLDGDEIEAAIVGLGLPEIVDGAALVRLLTDRGIPVVVYTGLGREEAHRALGDLEPAGVIVKPASDEMLVQAVQEAIRNR